MMSKAKAEWSQIDWTTIQTKVTKLQNRVYLASKCGNLTDVVKLQKMLIQSYSARLLAVRRAEQKNKVKDITAVIELAENLKLDGKASPLNTLEDRAKQALAKLALEPQWEATFEPNSYGHRKGNNYNDAITAIELVIRPKPKYVLDADLNGCFDNINHENLLKKLNTFPVMENQVRGWLKSGILQGEVFVERETPQIGVISPLLANIALDGLETFINQQFSVEGKMGEAKVIRYANQLLIIHEHLEVIEKAKEQTGKWMAEMGLKLNEQRTKITHTLRKVGSEAPGFDFLGFNIRSYEVGKTKAVNTSHCTRVQPSLSSVQDFRKQIKQILKIGHSMSPSEMIERHNRFVRGWANYFKTGDSSHKIFRSLQNDLYKLYLAWGRKKFSQRGDGYIVKKIFHASKYSNWNFGWKEGNKLHLATTLYEYIDDGKRQTQTQRCGADLSST